MQTDLFNRVSSKTADQLQRLEENHALNALFQGKCTLDQYLQILAAFFHFFSIYEARMVKAGTGEIAGSLFYTHLKTPLLEADLAALDYRILACPLPSAFGLDHAGISPIEALGSWYILEKATSGWSRLTKLLKRRYGLDAATGLAFFNNYGSRFEIFWDEFHLFITSQVRYPTDEREFTRSASDTVTALNRWIDNRFPSSMANLRVDLPLAADPHEAPPAPVERPSAERVTGPASRV